MTPRYGALGATLQIARLFQSISLIAIIGITAKFISSIISAKATPPNLLIGTISVTSIAVLYCIITIILYIDNILPFLLTSMLDSLTLIGFLVVAVVAGKPLSYLDCTSLSSLSYSDATAYAFSSHLDSYLAALSRKIEYQAWIGASRGICLEMKAVWGLSIGLCVMFFFSSLCSVCLWRLKKVLASAEEK